MKALRIILTQSKAHYRKEETVDNKMTYPLPPFSTVIGAIHKACGFKEYHPMNLCIQGKYSSLIKQPYTDYCFLDRVMNDRGILVKKRSPYLFNSEFDRVAEAKKPTGVDFQEKKNILIVNQKLYDDFFSLKGKNGKKIKNGDNPETEDWDRYESLTTSLKFYEVLHDVRLILHITSDEEALLETIEKNIYNLKSIGRSEDFVDIENYRIINLREIQEGEEIESSIPGYVNYELIKNKSVFLDNKNKGIPINGTKYYLGKVYNRDKGFRDFGDRVKVVYTSNYDVDEDSENIYIDDIKDEKIIVQFS